MIRKAVSFILILSFSNYLVGCSHEKTLLSTNVRLVEEHIIGATLITGERIFFDRTGGARYEPGSSGFGGSTEGGRYAFVGLNDVLELRSLRPLVVSRESARTVRLAEIVKWNRTVVTFDSLGARIDSGDGNLKGRTIRGDLVSIHPRDLTELRTTWPQRLGPECARPNSQCFIAEIITKEGLVATFDQQGAQYRSLPARMVGMTSSGFSRSVSVDSILSVDVTRVDPGLTILAVLGISAAVFVAVLAIALATKQSCPFVYSWDGNRFQFDAEPLGGSICRGMERTDYSRLDHLVPEDGKYKLLVRNEVNETQYVDEMALVVVDHQPGTTVIPDLNGNFTCTRKPVRLAHAIDERGSDLSRFLSARDDVSWQTHMAPALSGETTAQRHHITITFPKPTGAGKATLLTHVGTTAWGSNMIRKMVEYRGDSTEAWLDRLQFGTPDFMELFTFNMREELYYLKVWVQEPDGWMDRTILRGGGPLMNEDRAYALDISRARGDSLVLRLDPPAGFWVIDYLGIEYSPSLPVSAHEIAVRSALDGRGSDLVSVLRQRDGQYHSMPVVGDWAQLAFDVPAYTDSLVRSVFLKTSGYYTLHLTPGRTQQAQLVRQIGEVPGFITTVSMKEYRAWVTQLAQSR